MRGKPTDSALLARLKRITPADAGKTFLRAETTVLHEDHPRGCGENFFAKLAHAETQGSPPRMRGKHCDADNCMDDCRITPADAGKTIDEKLALHNA